MSRVISRVALMAFLLSAPGMAHAQTPTPSPLPPVSPIREPSFMPSPIPAPTFSPMDTIPPPLPPSEWAQGGDANELYRRIVELYNVGQYDEAAPLAGRYVAYIETRAGKENNAYAAAISLQARVCQAQGRLEFAEALVKRALAIHEHIGGPDHTYVANDIDALAQIYQEQGRLDDAEPLFMRALAINEKIATADPANVGRSLNNLAWLYQEQGRYAEAEPLMTRALSIIEKTLGTKHADYGRALDTLAKLHEGQGRLAEAAALYERALTIVEEALGQNHESVAATSENLGGLAKSQGRLSEAERHLKRALEIKEAVFGAQHPRLANALAQLGDLYRLQGKQREAESMFRRALSIQKAAIREIQVFFVTDRKQDRDAKAVSFGVERARTLSFGQATVMVPKTDVSSAPAAINIVLSNDAAGDTPSSFETTEVTRLAIHKVELAANESSFMQSARKKVEGAHVFPKQVFIFVHGYNVSFENAVRRSAQIAYDLNFDGAAFLFSWPSRNSLWSYTSDRESAEIAVNHLKELLQKVATETDATKIHLIAHSMGNLVLLAALEKIVLSRDSQLRLGFAEIVLHSPDVDEDRFSQLMQEIKDLGASVTLYASTGDRALGLSAWLWGVVGRAGATPAVVSGVETIDVTEAGSSLLGLNHDLYATNPAILNDMRRLLEFGTHPPDERSPSFQPKATEEGTYWQYRRRVSRPPQ